MPHRLFAAVRSGFFKANDQRPAIQVVGDLMLGRYLWGEVERISPVAPVPVVRLTRETERLGGAESRPLVASTACPTITKARVICGHQQMLTGP